MEAELSVAGTAGVAGTLGEAAFRAGETVRRGMWTSIVGVHALDREV